MINGNVDVDKQTTIKVRFLKVWVIEGLSTINMTV